MDHPDREAEVLGVAGALEHAVADAEVLVADPLEPEVGVGGAELPRPGERGVAELAVGEGGEGGIEGGAGHVREHSHPVCAITVWGATGGRVASAGERIETRG